MPHDLASVCAIVERSGLNPALDQLSNRVVFLKPDSAWGLPAGATLDSATLAFVREALTARLGLEDFTLSEQRLSIALHMVARGNGFNPVVNYLDGLRWNQKPYIARLFTDYFPCGRDDYTRAIGEAFLIGAVRAMRNPGSPLNFVPVLRGPSGSYGPAGLRALFGRERCSTMQSGLASAWLCKIRVGRSIPPAVLSFAARATNGSEPRRFACVILTDKHHDAKALGRSFRPLALIDRVDVEALARDRDGLWSEAAAREGEGEPCSLDITRWPACEQPKE